MNILVFALCALPASIGEVLYRDGALVTSAVVQGHEYSRVVTAVFLHAGLQHLGSNMLAQLLLGNAVERNIGHIRYGILYLTAGICGNLCSILYELHTGNFYRSVGASGAVYGVMGALVVIILRGRRQLRQGSSLMIRAGIMIAYAVYSGFQTPYINNAAHLGGMAAGVVLGFLMTIGKEQMDLQDLR